MDPALAEVRRSNAVALLVPLFLFSGATSLVYETLWERQLHLVVGTSQVAVITVLAAFMTGLALGGFAAGRVADRVRRPLQAYALLEGFIGLYAVSFPLVLAAVEPLYLNFWRIQEPSPTVFAIFQFGLLGLFLLPPTMCMGATLPLLARFATTRSEEAGKQVGRLYGANTLGAVIGVAMAGFVLLPNLGLETTTWVTAAGNLLLCLVAFGLGRSVGVLPLGDAAEPAGSTEPSQAPADADGDTAVSSDADAEGASDDEAEGSSEDAADADADADGDSDDEAEGSSEDAVDADADGDSDDEAEGSSEEGSADADADSAAEESSEEPEDDGLEDFEDDDAPTEILAPVALDEQPRSPVFDLRGAASAAPKTADAPADPSSGVDDPEAPGDAPAPEASSDAPASEDAPGADLPEAAAARVASSWVWLTAAVAFLAGLASLLYEVSWFRLMVLTLGGSAYAFSIMLLAFLLGIGIGGWAGGRLSDRALARGGLTGVLRLVTGLQIAVAVSAWLLMFTYNEMPFYFVWVYSLVEDAPQLLWPAKLFIAVSIMLPPALFMGATFPALVRATALSSDLGGPVGRLYGWNTVGAILGASLGGIALLPSIQVRGTVLVAVSINIIAALLASRAVDRSRSAGGSWPKAVGWTLVAACIIGLIHWRKPPWDPLRMTAGMYKYVSDLDPAERTRQGILDFAVEPYELIFYEEGLSSVVTVAKGKDSDNIWLANNGKVDASTVVDMPTQVMCAHLAFLFRQEAEDVLLIGLASGITAGSVTKHDNLETIEVIELEPAIVRASHFFDEHNSRPLDDPRVELIANDGRNHLNLQDDETYDVIISEPSNPWLTGVSNLFTSEFFFLGKSKLRPGGVWSQWVQMYGMDERDLRTLLRTFAETYAHVRLFSTIEDADLVLIGSDAPLELDVDVVGRLMDRQPKVREEMAVVDLVYPEDVLTLYQVDREGILGFSEGAPLNSDDNMLIEYSAPLHLHEDTAEANFAELLEDTESRGDVPVEMVEGVEGRIDLSRAYARRGDWLKALLVLKEAEAEEPGNPYVFELYDRYQRALQAELNDEEIPPDARIDHDPRDLDQPSEDASP